MSGTSPYNSALEQGVVGSHLLNSAEGAVTTAFGGFSAVTNVVLAGLTAPDMTNASDLVGVTIPAGFYFATRIDSIELTSGTGIAYERIR